MKKIVNITLCILLLLAALLIFFTSCSHEHAFGEWETVIEPSCIAEGRQERACECGERETQVMPMIAHEKGDWVTIFDQTCTLSGLRERICVCGEKETERPSPLGHVPGEWKIGTEASVFSKGSRYTSCTRCNVTLETQDIPQIVSHGLAYKVNADGTTCTVTGIGTCQSLYIGIPKTIDGYKVVAIADSPDWRDKGIKHLFIPEGVLYIGYNVIPYDVEKISIPNSVVTMHTSSQALPKFYTPYGNAYYLGNEENPYLVLMQAVSENITSCEIHERTKIIAENAFEFCNNLTSVTIPASVKVIGAEAFAYCDKLETVILSVGLEKIERNAFFDCPSLKEITLPAGLKDIGDSVFSTSDLNKLNPPDSLTQIGSYAFGDLDKFTHEYGNAYYVGTVQNPYMILYKVKDKTVTSFNVHEDTRMIYYEAFAQCENLKSVELPENLISIDSAAFNFCVLLEAIRIPDSVNYIGRECFIGCENLKTVTLPEALDTISPGLFWGCEALENVNIPKSVTAIGSHAFFECKSLKEVTIPEGVTVLSSNVFANCISISKIKLHDKITTIEEGAFYRCTGLKGITIPESVINIGAYAFGECENLVYADILGNVEYIAYGAFYECKNLIKVTLSNGIGKIAYDVFDGCESLDLNEYESGLYLGTKENPYLVLIRVKDLPGLSFRVHPYVKIMSTSAFKNCSSIENILLPPIIDSIDSNMFMGCKNLTSLTIPKTVTYIDYSPFMSCENLKNIYYDGTLSEWKQIYKYGVWDKGLSDYTVHCTDGDITN